MVTKHEWPPLTLHRRPTDFSVGLPVSHADLLEEFQRARQNADWARMEALFHREALSETLAAPGAAFPPRELVSLIRTAMTSNAYSVGDWTVEEIDETTALAHGRARYRIAGGFRDERKTWIFTFRDGLIWRSCIVADRDAAIAHLEQHGPGLGL